MQEGTGVEATLQLLQKLPENCWCFDCGQVRSTYAAPQLGIFLCVTCAGLHRELNHRVKGLAVSTFLLSEVQTLQQWGNARARQLWLGRRQPPPVDRDPAVLRRFLREKYVERRYCNPMADPQFVTCIRSQKIFRLKSKNQIKKCTPRTDCSSPDLPQAIEKSFDFMEFN